MDQGVSKFRRMQKMEEVYSAQTSEVALEAIINNAVQIPGVKVD